MSSKVLVGVAGEENIDMGENYTEWLAVSSIYADLQF